MYIYVDIYVRIYMYPLTNSSLTGVRARRLISGPAPPPCPELWPFKTLVKMHPGSSHVQILLVKLMYFLAFGYSAAEVYQFVGALKDVDALGGGVSLRFVLFVSVTLLGSAPWLGTLLWNFMFSALQLLLLSSSSSLPPSLKGLLVCLLLPFFFTFFV